MCDSLTEAILARENLSIDRDDTVSDLTPLLARAKNVIVGFLEAGEAEKLWAGRAHYCPAFHDSTKDSDGLGLETMSDREAWND